MNLLDQQQNILKLNHSLLAEDVKRVAFFSDQKLQILAIVLSNSDIVLWKVIVGNTNHIVKWIPWRSDENSEVRALTFQTPSLESTVDNKIQLLVITYDGTLYLISVKEIINGETFQYHHSKLSLFPSCPIASFVPFAVEWWNSSHHQHKNIAIIGGDNGHIVFFSLTSASYITSLNTGTKSPIFSLSVCSDFFRDYSYLLVTNDLRQQWKLLLEKEVKGEYVILIAFGDYAQKTEKHNELTLKSQKSRLQEFKQMSVETFSLLKQKLNDTRKITNDRLKTGNIHVEMSELQSCDCYGEAFLSVQQYRNRRVLTGLFIPEAVLLLYLQNKDSTTLIHHKFKISPLVTRLLLTHTFVYVADIMDMQHRILVFSTRISESKKSEPAEYNPACFVQSFIFPENEQIINLFKMEVKFSQDEKLKNAVSFLNTENSSSSQSRSKVKQMQLEDEWGEACLVVTNKGVYVISLRDNPLKLALESMKTDLSVIRKLTLIFNLPLLKTVELLANQLVEDKNIADALTLCKTFNCFSGKATVKLASFGFIEELLEHAEYLLIQRDLDLPLVERIHLSNFVVTCYAERYLRNPCDEIIRKLFMKFLRENQYYDEEVNIYILGNYRLCSFVHFLSVWRGLYVDGAVALTNMIAQNHIDKYKTLHKFDGFWQLFSETSLVDAFVLSPRTVHLHISFLREYVKEIPSYIMKRLYHFYDPTQPVLKPAICRMLRTSREEYLEAYDFENDKWGCDANMFDWVTNFLYLHIHLFKERNLDCSLTKYTVQSLFPSSTSSLRGLVTSKESSNSVSAPVLCAGFAHAALVRNGSLVLWGQSTFGCLGAGPTLSQNCVPILNSWFDDHRIRVKLVSCGKHHTLALTENGVYSWGCSKYGQLGIGHGGQSVYPRMVESLSSYFIVSIAAGQYHSLATDISGKLWTWGWGVFGQLGHGDTDDQFYPKCVEKLKKKFIVNACGGQAHSIVLTRKGKVFTFGCNTYGQLGIGTCTKSSTPVKVFGLQENIIMVATNYFHNLALSDTNRLYTWGCSPQILKLQAQTQKRAKSMPNVVEKVTDSVVHVEKCNNRSDLTVFKVIQNSSFDHLPADHNKHLSPVLVDTSLVEGNIMQISCGLFHSALLTTESHIYTWGRNTDGQLGNCKRQTDVSLPTLVNIFQMKLVPNNKQHVEMLNRPLWRVSCGKDYTLAVELESRLFGWGNNSCGQLGTLPQEDFSIKRFLNGKFIVNKYAKRMIKISHGGVNIVEKPVEISGLPKLQFLFVQDGNSPARYLRLECSLDFPPLIQPHYIIQNTHDIAALNATNDQILHYYLECFHRYYKANFILQTCVENNNLQAASKVCCLNYRFYDAFFYGLKALLFYVRENYYFTSFKDSYGLSENRLLAKTPTKRMTERVCNDVESAEKNDVFNTTTMDGSRKIVVFEFMEEVITEALSILENYYEMILKFTPEKSGSFLRKSISTWIVWELPIQPLEKFFSTHLESVANPLAVLLFCDRYKSPVPVNEEGTSNSSQISNSAWKERKSYLSAYLNKTNKQTSNKTIKQPFLNNSEVKACYSNLYQCKSDAYLESNDPKYKLSSEEILRSLSVPFVLKLCEGVVDSMSSKAPADYEEFVRFLHEVIFAPSVLKSDDRSADEVLASVLNTLQRSQSPPKKFIQISYEELCDKQIENKFIVFSCRHFFTSQTDFEKEVKTIVRELDSLRLLNTSELVNRLFSESAFATCCPRCLVRCIEDEINSTDQVDT